MSREVFIPWKPHATTLAVVDQANTIIAEYLTEDFKLTLRQLFIHRPKKELSHGKELEVCR
jgi:hypothetical protein